MTTKKEEVKPIDFYTTEICASKFKGKTLQTCTLHPSQK